MANSFHVIEYDQPVLIPREKAKAKGLPESVEGWLDPGQLVYAVSVYHQMHCLNHIRKTFYADKFFPNETKEQVDFHKSMVAPSFILTFSP